jgi:hypothetical protein
MAQPPSPPWLTVPISNKRKKSDSSPSPSKSATSDGASLSKKLKLDQGPETPLDEAMSSEEGFEKVLTKEEKRKMKKDSAKAASKAVSRLRSMVRL